jgi:hypothetical protein
MHMLTYKVHITCEHITAHYCIYFSAYYCIYLQSFQDFTWHSVPAAFANNPNPSETFDVATDFDMSGNELLSRWYCRLQLLFRCTLCPAGAEEDIRRHIEVSLAYFSGTFEPVNLTPNEPVNLTPNSIMQREGVPMFYDSASSSALLSRVPMLGRVPMIPCFVAGNTQPTIPHGFARSGRAAAFAMPRLAWLGMDGGCCGSGGGGECSSEGNACDLGSDRSSSSSSDSESHHKLHVHQSTSPIWKYTKYAQYAIKYNYM